MKWNRRTFVKTGVIALTGTAVLGNTSCSSTKKTGTTGLQLYSIRDEMRADPLGSLTQLAEMDMSMLNMQDILTVSFTDIRQQNSGRFLMTWGLKW